MRVIFFYACLLFLASCAVKKGIPGDYLSQGRGYRIDLKLNKDSSFHISYNSFEVIKNGKGSWQIIHSDTLLLRCNTYQPNYYGITQDFLDGEILKLYIAKNGTLQYFKATLKKMKK